jgi:hypothetical protein
MPPPSLAYVAGGRLHLKTGDAPVRSYESAFGQQMRDRHVEIQQRHSWKSEGRGARFMSGLLWGGPERDPAQLQLAITGLTRGAAPGELLYVMDTEGRTAVCLFRTGDASERRLLHGSPERIRDLRASPAGDRIACSVLHPDFTASIGLMSPDVTDLHEITEGDAQDRFPAWVPGAGARLVYQSAGVGRDRAGQPTGLGPSEIHVLDLEQGSLETLASDPAHDLLCPQIAEDGTLYCMRRPRQGGRAASVGRMLLDVLLLPARLVYAVFQYLNFFSARYTGKPLMTAGGPKRQGADMRQMMVWSNLMQAGSAAEGDEPPPSVPRDWQLVRIRTGHKPETVASGVLTFDLGPDGTLLYSTGTAIHHLSPDGRHQRLLSEERVEALVSFC